MKERIFKFLFPSFHGVLVERKEAVANLRTSLMKVVQENAALIEKTKQRQPTMSDLMRDSLGLPMIHFETVDKEGKPPHFLQGLSPEARKRYIASMAQIYRNEEFQGVMSYTINRLGNHSLQVALGENTKNGQMGIVALKQFRKEFEEVLSEYEEARKNDNDFDEQSILPE